MPTTKEINAQAKLIREWLDGCNPLDIAVQAQIRRGLRVIMSRQTTDEQSSEQTRWRNGRGFTHAHAPFAAKILRWVEWRPTTARRALRMLRKYAVQLAEEKLGVHR